MFTALKETIVVVSEQVSWRSEQREDHDTELAKSQRGYRRVKGRWSKKG